MHRINKNKTKKKERNENRRKEPVLRLAKIPVSVSGGEVDELNSTIGHWQEREKAKRHKSGFEFIQYDEYSERA